MILTTAHQSAIAKGHGCNRFVAKITSPKGRILWAASHRDVRGVADDAADIVSLSLSSQTINPDAGTATIGGGSIKLLDYQQSLSTFFSEQFQADDDVFGAKVEVWEGVAGLSIDEFTKRTTQVQHGDVVSNGSSYTISTRSFSAGIDAEIFEPARGSLTTEVRGYQGTITGAIEWADSQPQGVLHDGNYFDEPTIEGVERVFYVRYVKTGEVVAHRGPSDQFPNLHRDARRGKFGSDAVDFSIYRPLRDGTVYVGVAGFYYLTLPFPDLINADYSLVSGPDASIATLTDSTFLTGSPIRGVAQGVTTFTVRVTSRENASVSDHTIAVAVGPEGVDAYSPDFDVRGDNAVEEYVYLEGHPAELAHLILTGFNFDGERTIPENWSLNLPLDRVDSECFRRIYDKASNLRLPIEQPGKTKARAFLQNEILALMRWSLVDDEEGRLCLVESADGAQPVARLGAGELSGVPAVTHVGEVYNQLVIKWGYNPKTKAFANVSALDVPWSREKYGGVVKTRTLEFKLLQPGFLSARVVNALFLAHIRYYAQPRIKIAAKILRKASAFSIGDVVDISIGRVKALTPARDYSSTDGGFNRSCQARALSLNSEGAYKATFVASRGENVPVAPLVGTITVPDSAYRVGTRLGDDVELSGETRLAAGEYHADGVITIAAGAVLRLSTPGTIKLLAARGIRILGDIDLAGAGGFSGSGAGFGIAQATGGVLAVHHYGRDQEDRCNVFGWTHLISTPASNAVGDFVSLSPILPLLKDGQIIGLPKSLDGVAGPAGGNFTAHDVCDGSIIRSHGVVANGGAGGRGGGGLVTVSPVIEIASSANVTLDGAAGGEPQRSEDVYAGAGGSGSPGAWLHVQTSNAVAPDISRHTSGQRPAANDGGNRMSSPSIWRHEGVVHSYFTGAASGPVENTRVAHLA